MFELDNKIAVVIGGAGGFGSVCAKQMAVQKARVAIADLHLDQLQITAEKIEAETGQEVLQVQVDVTREESVEQLKEQVLNKFSTLDILVNAQGINAKQPSTEIDFDSWDSLFAVNVRGVMLPCKVLGKIMVDQKYGKIINLSSVRGIRGGGGDNTIYGATKGSVDMITKMLAVEWAKFNVKVNAIGPSIAVTEMMTKIFSAEQLEEMRQSQLLKKFCTPDDVAAACIYLAAPESDFVTGQIIYIDGGLTAVG